MATTERFMRTTNENLVWVNEWKSPVVFQEPSAQWIDEYNHHLPPVTFEQNTLSKAA